MQTKTLLKLSIATAVLTIVLKAAAWWITDSVGLLSDAMESFVNLASAVFALMMVTVAEEPPDEDHPFGHTKAEYFSSGFEGLLIVGAALGMIWVAAHRFFEPQPLSDLGWGIGLAVVSSALNGMLAWRMMAVAREQRSIVLEADAKHLVVDVWTSTGVVVALLLVPVTGWYWLDPLIAIAVALNILREGWSLSRRSVDGLMDTALEPEVRQQIDRTLAQFAHATIRFDHLVTRRAGQRRFLDVHMHMPAGWSLGRAAALRTSVEQALMAEVPGLRASIQLLPSDVEAHFNDPKDPL
jgi:cation diffusion facilitator family transporter